MVPDDNKTHSSMNTGGDGISSVNSTESQSYWRGIVEATKTPLGLFALVLLVINGSLLIIVARGEAGQVFWIALSLVGLAFLLVIAVTFLEIKKTPQSKLIGPEIRIFLGAPARLEQLDLSLIEWDEKKCFIIVEGRK